MNLLFEYKNSENSKNYIDSDFEFSYELPEKYIRKEKPDIPNISEPEVIKHFTSLAKMNHGVDSGSYPLGSCTMKYNPKVNEEVSGYDGFNHVHPLQDEKTTQGLLELCFNLQSKLSKITGMDNFSLQPSAGAHGEFAGLLIIKAYLKSKSFSHKDTILIPDSAHGTNPASAAMAGFKVVKIPSDERGNIDIEIFKQSIDENTAGLMLTNPNTLGLFEENIIEIASLIHNADGLLYYDGANANAILQKSRPGDMGFDVLHLNLHKTFSTPHGGGGPGAGPVGVKAHLTEFLPNYVVKEKHSFINRLGKKTIGNVRSFYGNLPVLIRTYAYILTIGERGLSDISENAVLNANYLMHKLSKIYNLAYVRTCMHEFVLSAEDLKKDYGIMALDIAKMLLDYKIHPPTIYFPLIVKEAMMIEPTETESIEGLDNFIDIMTKIHDMAKQNPEVLKNAPKTTIITRLDEVRAVKEPRLRY